MSLQWHWVPFSLTEQIAAAVNAETHLFLPAAHRRARRKKSARAEPALCVPAFTVLMLLSLFAMRRVGAERIASRMAITLPQPAGIPSAKTLPPAVPPAPIHTEPLPSAQPPVQMRADTSSWSMQVTCTQQDLAHGLAHVSAAVLGHTTLPILENILISTDGGRLRLSSTDLELGVQAWLDAQIQVEGTTAVPAERFKRVVATLPSGCIVQLCVPRGAQHLVVLCAGTRVTINSTADPREFPVLPGIEGTEQHRIEIDAGVLATMIEQVAFAADKDLLGKPMWASVKMVSEDGTLTLAAADSIQVAERQVPLPTAQTGMLDILVPARNLQKLKGILPTQGMMTIMVTPKQNQVVFHLEQGEQMEIVSRLIEARYPNYRAAFPTQRVTRVVMETSEVLAALKGAALFAVDRKRSVRLTFTPGMPTGSLLVESDDAVLGEMTRTLPAEISGPEQQVFFPVEYLLTALTHIDAPQVSMEIIETGRPVLLKPIGALAYTILLQTMSRAPLIQ